MFGPLAFLFLIFPTGQPPSRRWGWLLRVMLVAFAVLMIGFALTPGSLEAGFAELPRAGREPDRTPFGLEAGGRSDHDRGRFDRGRRRAALGRLLDPAVPTRRSARATADQVAGVPRRLPRDDPRALLRLDRHRRHQRRRGRFRAGLLRLRHRRVPRHPCGLRHRDPAARPLGPGCRRPEDRAVRAPRRRVRDRRGDRRSSWRRSCSSAWGAASMCPRLAVAAVLAVGFTLVRSRARRWANRIVYGKRSTPYEVLSEFAERVGETYSTEDVLPRMAQLLGDATGARTARVWLRIGNELRAETSWPVDAPAAASVAVHGRRAADLRRRRRVRGTAPRGPPRGAHRRAHGCRPDEPDEGEARARHGGAGRARASQRPADRGPPGVAPADRRGAGRACEEVGAGHPRRRAAAAGGAPGEAATWQTR